MTSQPPGDCVFLFLWPQRADVHSDLIPKSRRQRSRSTRHLFQASSESSGLYLVFPSRFWKTRAREGQRLGGCKGHDVPILQNPTVGGSTLSGAVEVPWKNCTVTAGKARALFYIKAFQGWGQRLTWGCVSHHHHFLNVW